MERQTMRHIKKVVPLGDGQIWLEFTDGRKTMVDLTNVIAKGGVFEQLRNPAIFKKVRLENGGRAIVWPGSVDFCADALYGPSHVRKRRPIRATTSFGAEVFVPEKIEPRAA